MDTIKCDVLGWDVYPKFREFCSRYSRIDTVGNDVHLDLSEFQSKDLLGVITPEIMMEMRRFAGMGECLLCELWECKLESRSRQIPFMFHRENDNYDVDVTTVVVCTLRDDRIITGSLFFTYENRLEVLRSIRLECGSVVTYDGSLRNNFSAVNGFGRIEIMIAHFVKD